jgi:hypothetical protein
MTPTMSGLLLGASDCGVSILAAESGTQYSSFVVTVLHLMGCHSAIIEGNHKSIVGNARAPSSWCLDVPTSKPVRQKL